jgi:hypothetical protein
MSDRSRRFSASAVVLIAVVAALAASLTTAAIVRQPGRSGSPEVAPVATVRDLMRMLDPSADAIWGSVGFVVTLDGETEIAPADEEEWVRLEAHALTLIGAGRLLEYSGPGADDVWNARARALSEAGRLALAAVRARDKEAVMSAGEQITITCDTCHQSYWDDTNVELEQ